jgi:hypothetical protein
MATLGGGNELKTAFVSAQTPGEVNDATPQNALGTILVKYDTLNYDPGQHARTYRYVQLHSGATAAKGALVIWQDYFNNVVTTVGTNTTLRNTVAGALQSAACTAGNYTFILIKGPGVTLNENATAVVIGQQAISGATTTGRFDISAVGTAAITGPWGVYISAKNASVNGSAALGTDVAACYLNVPQPEDR